MHRLNSIFKLVLRKVTNQSLCKFQFRRFNRGFSAVVNCFGGTDLIGVMHGMEHQHIAIGANQYEVLFTTHYEFGERGSLALGHRGIQQMIGLGRSGPASNQVRFFYE
jgi:hypothetical protein